MKTKKIILKTIQWILIIISVLATAWICILYFTGYFEFEKVYTDAFPKETIALEDSTSDYTNYLKSNDGWGADAPTKKVREYQLNNYWILGDNPNLIFSTSSKNSILIKPDFVYPEIMPKNISRVTFVKYNISDIHEITYKFNWMNNQIIFDPDWDSKQTKVVVQELFDESECGTFPSEKFFFSDLTHIYNCRFYFYDVPGLFYQNNDIRIMADINGDFWISYSRDPKLENYRAKKLSSELNDILRANLKK